MYLLRQEQQCPDESCPKIKICILKSVHYTGTWCKPLQRKTFELFSDYCLPQKSPVTHNMPQNIWTGVKYHLIFVKPPGVTPLNQEINCDFFFVMVQTRRLHNVQMSKFTFHFWIPVIHTLCIYIYHSINFIQLSTSLKMAHKWEDICSLLWHPSCLSHKPVYYTTE